MLVCWLPRRWRTMTNTDRSANFFPSKSQTHTYARSHIHTQTHVHTHTHTQKFKMIINYIWDIKLPFSFFLLFYGLRHPQVFSAICRLESGVTSWSSLSRTEQRSDLSQQLISTHIIACTLSVVDICSRIARLHSIVGYNMIKVSPESWTSQKSENKHALCFNDRQPLAHCQYLLRIVLRFFFHSLTNIYVT